MFSEISIGLFFLILVCLFSLVSINVAFRRLQRKDSKLHIDKAGKLFFYRKLSALFFPHHEYEALYFANLFTQNAMRFFYVTLSILFVIHYQSIKPALPLEYLNIADLLLQPYEMAYLFGMFLILLLFGEYIPRILGTHYPQKIIKLCAPIVSTCMLIFFPFNYLFLKAFNLFPQVYVDPSHEPINDAKQELLEIIEEFNLNTQLDPHDKKLIESVMEFKYRIAREVMVPRVDIFCLPAETTIEEAAKLLYQEGFSRVPVYKDTLDNIIGVLMYKDVLAKYMEHEQKEDSTILKNSIATLVKSIIYTPETKKISHLLQEFKKKQVHLAIIVDEYGGTEGIVTIEDILEEIVGDIADEYDETEALCLPLDEGGWLVDARMSILDIEESIGVAIPQDGDYDTLGGYIFHETGMIPTKGYLITQPEFEIEILRSNDRRVEKLRIKSLVQSDDS